MIKNDLVNRVTEETGVPRVQASRAVETIIEAMRRSLAGGGRIELRGFGVFL
ncbi:partial DNA-binding protein HU, partial [Gammaproteobacteria bacterium]